MKKLGLILAGILVVMTGCSTAKIEDYADAKPELDIRDYLNGNVEAWGTFIDRSGKADPTFHVTMKGAWHGDQGTVSEHFDYSDGRKQDRSWTFAFSDDHNFTGTAADVVGVAQGTQYGNAANLKYVLAIQTEDGDTHDMSMDDWLYRMSDDTLINHNVMRKFGIKFGELIITFRKLPPHKS